MTEGAVVVVFVIQVLVEGLEAVGKLVPWMMCVPELVQGGSCSW
jgi:hypothetical protein